MTLLDLTVGKTTRVAINSVTRKYRFRATTFAGKARSPSWTSDGNAHGGRFALRPIALRRALLVILLTILHGGSGPAQQADRDDAAARRRMTPEKLAIQFLSKEVPSWFTEHNCRSCHNNGDAARTLYIAIGDGFTVRPSALSSTNQWLAHPRQWAHNHGDPTKSDKQLAALQFAWAASEAIDSGVIQDEGTTIRGAARLVASWQDEDGSWPVGAAGTTGSPITYGSCLATAAARQVLMRADADLYEARIERAETFLIQSTPFAVVDLAGVILGLKGATGSGAIRQRERCVDRIGKAQLSSGAWGPFANRPGEVFDTAIAMIALRPLAERRAIKVSISRAREYLVARQQPRGDWPETTRPAGAESYAHQISTTAWAAQALILTKPDDIRGDEKDPDSRNQR